MSDIKISQSLTQSLNSSSTTSSTSSIQGSQSQNDMLSSFCSNKNEQPGIIEVYEDNFVSEIKNKSRFFRGI